MQAATAVPEGFAEADVVDGLGEALVAVGLGDEEVAAGVAEELEEPDGAAAGVPLPPRPVSSQRTPSSSTRRTTITTARRNQ